MAILILGDGITTEPVFYPSLISPDHMPLLFKDVPASVKEHGKQCLAEGWKIFTVKQERGKCYYQSKVITIPTWVIDHRSVEEKTWYISHEIAHKHAGWHAKHGPEFMEWLKRICPSESIHFELGYKPRNAASAGITKLFKGN
jgi:hypothetical protein